MVSLDSFWRYATSCLHLLSDSAETFVPYLSSFRLLRSVHVQISSMMSFVNVATKWDSFPLEGRRIFTLLLAPFAPHLAEELWHRQASEQKTLVPTSALAMRSLVQVSTWSKPLMVLLHSHS